MPTLVTQNPLVCGKVDSRSTINEQRPCPKAAPQTRVVAHTGVDATTASSRAGWMHIDGRCFKLPVARSLVAEPEGATDMAGAPTHGAAWGSVLGVEKNGRGGLFMY